MRISRDTIGSTLRNIASEKEAKYLERLPKPTPPTDKEIAEAIRSGAFKLATKCGCEVRSSWSGYTDRFPLDHILKVNIVEDYLKKADAHRTRLEAFKKKVEVRRKEDFTYCAYGPGQVEKGAFYARVEAFRAWKP